MTPLLCPNHYPFSVSDTQLSILGLFEILKTQFDVVVSNDAQRENGARMVVRRAWTGRPVWKRVSKGEEDGRRPPILPLRPFGGGPPTGRIWVRHGGPA
jgi:hypothetical protein